MGGEVKAEGYYHSWNVWDTFHEKKAMIKVRPDYEPSGVHAYLFKFGLYPL